MPITFNFVHDCDLFLLRGQGGGNNTKDLQNDPMCTGPLCHQHFKHPERRQRITLELATFITEIKMLEQLFRYFLTKFYRQFIMNVFY